MQVVDALEFASALCESDVADELAFLEMDLERLGHPDVARRAVSAYVDHDGDPGPADLRAFYASHRALVRAKVAMLRDRGRSEDEVRPLLELAERCAARTLPVGVQVVCGPSGSGKSFLAQRLAARTGMPVISSDLVRKELAGLACTDRGSAQLYDPLVTWATYEELGRRSRAVTDTGRAVIVDATCTTAADRRALRDGLGAGAAPTAFVSCTAPTDVLRRRVLRRARDPLRVSDATGAVLERQLARRDPLDEVPASRHLVVRTDRRIDDVADLVQAAWDA